MQKLLRGRARTHGGYTTTADIAQQLKDLLRQRMNARHTAQHRESLDLIATKIARILSGDPSHTDHWRDIAGYALLNAEDE